MSLGWSHSADGRAAGSVGSAPSCWGCTKHIHVAEISLGRLELHSALGLHCSESLPCGFGSQILLFIPFFFYFFAKFVSMSELIELEPFFHDRHLHNDDNHSECCYYLFWFLQVLRENSEGIPWCDVCMTFRWTGPPAELWLFQASGPELELWWQHSCSLSAEHRWQFISIILQG